MREIDSSLISEVVARLCIDANYHLPPDMKRQIISSSKEESWETASIILDQIIENFNIADENLQPICQDTGLACVFLSIGQDVHIKGNLEEAVNEGVRKGYSQGYLRKSKITVAPKGFGSENMSQIKMLKPSDGIEGVKDFVIKVVEDAGPNPCPPIVVGVGIGGTFDKAAYLAKKALMRPVDQRNSEDFYAELEEELLEKINALGIGPQGFGGKTTALAVNIEKFPTHIAGLPVAVNINCHVTRHMTEEI